MVAVDACETIWIRRPERKKKEPMIGNVGTPGHVEQCQNGVRGEGKTVAHRMRGAVQKHTHIGTVRNTTDFERGWDAR